MSIEQYRGKKKNSMSIFYVALSTCLLVLLSCRLINLILFCHVVLSTWSVILRICPVILSTCYVILSHYGMAPVDLRCLQKRKSHDYLHTHKRMPTHIGPLIQDWSVCVLIVSMIQR